MEGGLVEDEVEEAGVVGLNDEEEQLLGGDGEECRADDDLPRVCPYLSSDEVGVPRDGRGDGDADEEEYSVNVQPCEEWTIEARKSYRWGDGVFEMPKMSPSVCLQLWLVRRGTYTRAYSKPMTCCSPRRTPTKEPPTQNETCDVRASQSGETREWKDVDLMKRMKVMIDKLSGIGDDRSHRTVLYKQRGVDKKRQDASSVLRRHRRAQAASLTVA
jgi:hypothetical protein